MSARFLWPLAAAAALAVSAPPAHAVVRTFVMEGSITAIEDPFRVLGYAHLEDRVAYTFSLDSEAPDTNPTLTLADYAGLASTLLVGQTNLGAGAPGITIQHPADLFSVASAVQSPDPQFNRALTRFDLADQIDSNAIADTLLPSQPYDLSLFNQARHFQVLFYTQGSYDRHSFSGPIDLWFSSKLVA